LKIGQQIEYQRGQRYCHSSLVLALFFDTVPYDLSQVVLVSYTKISEQISCRQSLIFRGPQETQNSESSEYTARRHPFFPI
jgi:hypothetical protein